MKQKASLAVIERFGLCVCHGIEREHQEPLYNRMSRASLLQDFINIESLSDVMRCANEIGHLTHDAKADPIEVAAPRTPTRKDVIDCIPWTLKRSEIGKIDECLETWGFVRGDCGGRYPFSPLPAKKESPYNIQRSGGYMFCFEPVTDWLKASQDLRIACLLLCNMIESDQFGLDFQTSENDRPKLMDTENAQSSCLASFYSGLIRSASSMPGSLGAAGVLQWADSVFGGALDETDALRMFNLMMPRLRKEFFLGKGDYPLCEPPANSAYVEDSCNLQDIWKDVADGFLSKKIGVCRKCGKVTVATLRQKHTCKKSHENPSVKTSPALCRMRFI